mmetsp:Transcript_50/g.141  ORF Transcript_50/g.141 Transcript_50/m.141 type:complete len:295 (+) Transcript_50:137-1021(+)
MANRKRLANQTALRVSGSGTTTKTFRSVHFFSAAAPVLFRHHRIYSLYHRIIQFGVQGRPGPKILTPEPIHLHPIYRRNLLLLLHQLDLPSLPQQFVVLWRQPQQAHKKHVRLAKNTPVGVAHAHDSVECALEARLLRRLPHRGLSNVLPRVHQARGHLPQLSPCRRGTGLFLDHQHLLRQRVYYDGADPHLGGRTVRQPRYLVFRQPLGHYQQPVLCILKFETQFDAVRNERAILGGDVDPQSSFPVLLPYIHGITERVTETLNVVIFELGDVNRNAIVGIVSKRLFRKYFGR